MRLKVLQFNLGRAFRSGGDLADDPRLLAGFAQYVQRGFHMFLRYADDHAHAAVQHTRGTPSQRSRTVGRIDSEKP